MKFKAKMGLNNTGQKGKRKKMEDEDEEHPSFGDKFMRFLLCCGACEDAKKSDQEDKSY